MKGIGTQGSIETPKKAPLEKKMTAYKKVKIKKNKIIK